MHNRTIDELPYHYGKFDIQPLRGNKARNKCDVLWNAVGVDY